MKSRTISKKDVPTIQFVLQQGNPHEWLLNHVEKDQFIQGFGLDTEQGHHVLFQTEALWQVSQGEGVTIAVIDSGVDSNHYSLTGAVLPGFDFINNLAEQRDENGHGTAVASLIASRNRLYGLAPKAKILPLRVLDENNTGSLFDLSRALLYAADLLPGMSNPHPADIINLSLGQAAYSPLLHDVIRRITDKNIIIIAAAGNSGQGSLSYPAAYPEVFSVGAALVSRGKWSKQPFSNYGAGLNLLAPLGGVAQTNHGYFGESLPLSAHLDNETRRFGGTSAAAAMISGVVALLVSAGADSREALGILETSSTDIDQPGWDSKTGFGIVNPSASLRAVRGEQATDKETIAIQILDAESLQEHGFYRGDSRQTLSVVPGHYQLNIWLDRNGDGLKQADEPSQRTTSQYLAAESTTHLDILLHTPDGSY